MRLAISLATAATALIANGANPDVIKPIKDFTPPPRIRLISPKAHFRLISLIIRIEADIFS